MSDSPAETIALDSHGMDGAIAALSSAAVSFGLNTRQRFMYRALMINVDLGAAALVFMWLLQLAGWCGGTWWPEVTLDLRDLHKSVQDVVVWLFLGSLVSGLLAFLLGAPTIKSVFRERERLEALGLDALVTSFWRVRRKHSFWSGLREAVLACLGAVYALGAVVSIVRWVLHRETMLLLIVPSAMFLAALFLGAWILRVQKEKIELAAEAVQLKQALLSLRERKDSHDLVPVPVEVVRQAAMIESAHAAKDRQAAILQDAGKESPGYAIAFSPECLEQRNMLNRDERLELEELLVDLGASGAALPGVEVEASVTPQAFVVRTAGRRVTVEFSIDKETRTLLITRLRYVSIAATPRPGADA